MTGYSGTTQSVMHSSQRHNIIMEKFPRNAINHQQQTSLVSKPWSNTMILMVTLAIAATFICTSCMYVYIGVCNYNYLLSARMRSEGYSSCLVCVCLSAPFRPLRVNVSPQNDTNASSRQDKENKTGAFLKNAPFKSYGVICSLCRRSAVL